MQRRRKKKNYNAHADEKICCAFVYVDRKWKRHKKMNQSTLFPLHTKRIMEEFLFISIKSCIFVRDYDENSKDSGKSARAVSVDSLLLLLMLLRFFFIISNNNNITANKQKFNHFSYKRNWNSVMHGAHTNKPRGFFFEFSFGWNLFF